VIKDTLIKFFDPLRFNQQRNRHAERFLQIRFQRIPIHLTSIVSVAIPMAAGLLQWSLWSALSPLTWSLFYPAVFLSAYLGGVLSGLLATAMAVSMGIYFFIPPEGSFNIADVRYYYSTAIFSLMGLSFNLAFEQLRRSKAELQRIASLESEVNHRRLNQALRAANAGIWEWNLQTNENQWDEGLWRLYGLEPFACQASYDVWLSTVHPDDRAIAQAAIHQAVQQNIELNVEWRLAALVDGRERWLMSRGQPELDEKGRPLLYRGIVLDITERRQIEQSLIEKERLLADSQAVAHIGSWVRYLPGGQAMWSEETFRVFGLSPETDQALSMEQLLETVHPDDRAARRAWHQDCLAGNSGNGLEYRICTPLGQQRWVLSKAKLETTADGQPWRLIGTVQDITEAKLAAAEKQRWIDAFRYCGHGIAIGNPETGRLVTCNPAFAEMLGYDNADQFEGQLILSLYAPEYVESAAQRLHEADQFGKIRYESVYRRQDGSKFDVAVDLVSVKNAEQKVMYRVATVQDISVRKKQEMELLQYRDHLQNLVEQRTEQLNQALQRAEHLTQVKSSFVANMSHEIRTPMNAVLGFCYLLEQHALNEEEHSLVRKIRDAGRSLLAIINDILDFSKIEAGRLEIENLPFRLSDMFDHLAALMAAAADHKNLELIIIPPAGVDALIGDGLRIQQVLINLLGNAIKFTERGEVVLRVTVDDWQSGDTVAVRFAVSDTGIGISEPQLDDVFAAFTQADNTISRRFGGSGLGLAICRQLVNLMGGELRVNSVAGQGSEFWFVLRLQWHLDCNPAQSLPHLHHLKLLVVDDCETTREAVNTSARSLDWHANAVDSGEAAIVELLASLERAEPYDVLLLDWPMADVDGTSIAEAIRASLAAVNPDQPRIAIILMISSSYSRELLAVDADMKHVEGILSKPVTPSALYNAVAAVLSKPPPLPVLPDKSSNSAGTRMQGLRILVVDDSDINREVARRILESEGAQVSLACDGQDAVDWLFKNPGAVDLVLMDVQMPRMDGYAATRRIRKNPAWSDLPILALTAGAFKNLQEAALEAGMNDFIAKPFNVPQMLALIRRWTGNNSPLGVTGLASGDLDDGLIPRGQSAPLIVPTTPDPDEWPGIDVNAGLKMWHKRDLYQAYLARFVEQYRTAGRDISVAAEQGQLAELATLTHKLKGAAYGLALTEVAKRSVELETALHHSQPLAAAAAALQQALDVVIISIGNLSANTQSPLDHSAQREAPDGIKPLLSELLTALDEDNPGHAERLLLTLAGLVDTELLAPLATQIRDYNFRQAESLVLALINQLDIPKQ